MPDPQSTEVAAAAPAAVAKPQEKVVSVKAFVYKNMKSIEEALPRVGLTPEAVARTALSQIYRNPQLGVCDQVSIMRAIIEAASLGLSFALGRGYLVPFNNKHRDPVTGRESWRMEAQFMPGYQGLIDLVRRSAQVKTVVARAVYEGDEFSYSVGLNDDGFKHIAIAEPDPAKLTHTYCIIRFLDGGYQFEVLTRKQIDAVRARSKAKDSGPWVTDYALMAIKTVVKRTTKLCPASIELARAIEMDNAAETGEKQDLTFDGKLITDGDAAIEGGERPAIEVPVTATQAVSQQAAKTLAKARENAPETPKDEKPPEQPAPEKPAPATKAGPGRPPLPVCPGFGGEPCPDDHKLRSPAEKERNLCWACDERQIREGQQKQEAEVSPGEPRQTADELFAKLTDLALKARTFFTIDTGNAANAAIKLSELTGGKCQKFELLPEFLREHPEFMEKLQEAMR